MRIYICLLLLFSTFGVIFTGKLISPTLETVQPNDSENQESASTNDSTISLICISSQSLYSRGGLSTKTKQIGLWKLVPNWGNNPSSSLKKNQVQQPQTTKCQYCISDDRQENETVYYLQLAEYSEETSSDTSAKTEAGHDSWLQLKAIAVSKNGSILFYALHKTGSGQQAQWRITPDNLRPSGHILDESWKHWNHVPTPSAHSLSQNKTTMFRTVNILIVQKWFFRNHCWMHAKLCEKQQIMSKIFRI